MNSPRSPVALHKDLDALWGTHGRFGWLYAVNHTTIGRRFILTAAVYFVIGGLLGMLIRTQLASPQGAFVGAEVYNQLFTMHGTIMMFLFAVPMFEGMAMYLLPKILGARDLAFPRLSAYGYWCYAFGGSIVIGALLLGIAPDSGWFMYTPLSSQPYTPGINADIWLIGITFVEISALCGAIEIIVSILKLRAPGMSLDRMPLLAWYLLVTAFMMLAGFPPLILGSILLEIERAFDLPFFVPDRGGDPLLWQHLFWLFGHPEVYIIFLPAAGAISTILPVMARRRIIGHLWIVVSIIAMGFLSFGLWVHHMFTVGIPHLALGLFSAASMLVAVPTAVQIFAWIGTLMSGRPRMNLPMLYLIGFFLVFVPGGLTGVMVAAVPFDQQAHDTHFVVAHLHYVLVGGFLFPMLAAAYYWLPLFTGRSASSEIGRVGFWLILIGFNATFLVMHFTGLLGMPRRIFTYDAEFGWAWPNLVSSIGSFVMAIGFATALIDLFVQARFGSRSERNPWEATTLEWAIAKPPPSYTFASLPTVTNRDPLADANHAARDLAAGRGYLGFTRNGWLETLGVDSVTGKPEQIVILPGPTLWPLLSAVATGVFFGAVLLKLYLVALAGAGAVLVSFLFWAERSGLGREYGPLPVGHGLDLPVHPEATNPPARLATLLAITADATLFASLIFGVLFLVVSASGWPPPDFIEGGWLATVIGLSGWCAAALLMNAARGRPATTTPLLGAVLANVAVLAATVMLFQALPPATSHAYAAINVVLLAYGALHASIAIVFTVHTWVKSRSGRTPSALSLQVEIAWLWQFFSSATGAIGLAFVQAIPGLFGP
jgi:cytochrome c oxidase subunit I+III